jgi:hypothetical protein
MVARSTLGPLALAGASVRLGFDYAAAESQVLLKNDRGTLPASRNDRAVVVASGRPLIIDGLRTNAR